MRTWGRSLATTVRRNCSIVRRMGRAGPLSRLNWRHRPCSWLERRRNGCWQHCEPRGCLEHTLELMAVSLTVSKLKSGSVKPYVSITNQKSLLTGLQVRCCLFPCRIESRSTFWYIYTSKVQRGELPSLPSRP
jgi:hypothetical protein